MFWRKHAKSAGFIKRAADRWCIIGRAEGGSNVEREHIERVVSYIEEHLADDTVLDVAALAGVAGYSEFHFLRAFRKAVRLTPADYVRKRRISEIVRRIGKGESMSDIAFAWGFNSRENFTRAFKKEHGILPSAFRNAACSLRLYPPFSFERGDPAPAVSICRLEGFAVLAYPFGTDFAPTAWNRYNAEKRSLRLSGGTTEEDYGIMIRRPDGKLAYSIGIREERAKGDTAGTVRMEIRAGIYAVFDTAASEQHDFVRVIQTTWDWIYDVWMPENGWRRGPGYEFETYAETSRKYTERIFVPIVREED